MFNVDIAELHLNVLSNAEVIGNVDGISKL